MNEIKLKPCPFCGGEAVMYHQSSKYTDHDGDYVYCMACGCRTKLFECFNGTGKTHDDTEREAMNAWNGRLERAGVESVLEYAQYLPRYRGSHLVCEWISVDTRLPTPREYMTSREDGPDTLKRLLVAYKTDIIEYAIGCFDGYKWMNQLGNRKIENVIAWKPFEVYKP